MVNLIIIALFIIIIIGNNMRDRYLKVFKRSVVLLIILFVIVCFSFGVSYSNFIFSSTEHRAVEMHIDKLLYAIKINNEPVSEITVNPGINVYNVEIESLNKITSYYKLIVEQNDLKVYYLANNTNNKIDGYGKNNTRLVIFNSSNNNIKTKFLINGGYINNSLDDITVNNGYAEIKQLNIGEYITYNTNNSYNLDNDYSDEENSVINTNNNSYRILSVNDDNTIDIISENSVLLNNLVFSGSNGYNNFAYIINDIVNKVFSNNNTVYVRNININDIEKYTDNKIVNYNNIKSLNKELYIPTILEYDKNIVINGNNNETHNNDEFMLLDKLNSNKVVSSIVLSEPTISEYEFNNPIYSELFMNSNYLLSNRIVEVDNDNLLYGVYQIDNSSINFNNIYDSLNNDYSLTNIYVKPIIRLSNNTKIDLVNNKLEVK